MDIKFIKEQFEVAKASSHLSETIVIDIKTVEWLIQRVEGLGKECFKAYTEKNLVEVKLYDLKKQNERMNLALNVLKNRTNGWNEFEQFHFIAKQGLGEERCPLDWMQKCDKCGKSSNLQKFNYGGFNSMLCNTCYVDADKRLNK